MKRGRIIKRLFLVVLAIQVIQAGSFSTSTPPTEWIKTFQPEIGSYRHGRDVKQTLEGGFIIAASVSYWYVIYNFPNYYKSMRSHICLIRTDRMGNLLWQRTYVNSGNEEVSSICPTDDGGFILTGYTTSFGAGGSDVYLMKTDGSGNILWQKTFGGSKGDAGICLQQTSDGGYIIAGQTNSFGAGVSDIYLVRTDSLGNFLWQKVYGGSDSDEARSVQQTMDGGFIVAGSTRSFGAGKSDVYLFKVDAVGSLIWEKTFGRERDEKGWSVQQTYDGGFAVAGEKNDPNDFYGLGEDNIYLIRTDSLGNLLWERTFGDHLNDKGRYLLQTFDGGFVISGVWAEAYFEEGGPCLLRTDRFGNLIWQKIFKTLLFPTLISSVQQTYEGGFIATGHETGYNDSGPERWGVPLYKIGTEDFFLRKKNVPKEQKR